MEQDEVRQRIETCREIVLRLSRITNPSRGDVERIKFEVCRILNSTLPRNSDILTTLDDDEYSRLLPFLQTKSVRTLSGVAVISAMTPPYPCPKDVPCTYCPGGPSFGTPQSYTGHEPAAMRGKQNHYDPYAQVNGRMEQLKSMGHSVDKCELIIMGGTFPATESQNQEDFVRGCLDAITGMRTKTLEEAKLRAETSQRRCVGITVETRPDYCRQQHVDQMLDLGVTRVEMGVQTVYDDVYEIVDRGHTVADVIEATRVAKDSGLKVCYHLMLSLPSMTPERDLEAFKMVFEDGRFRPDMLKIYPCLVVPGSRLHRLWTDGLYEPYSTRKTIELLTQIKSIVPRWVRIMRVQRDIPSGLIAAGIKKSNLRQLVKEEMKTQGLSCDCIRCREVGHIPDAEDGRQDAKTMMLKCASYPASEGMEVFLTVEDVSNNFLVGYLRLRVPSEKASRPEIQGGESSIVRELRICGESVPLGRNTTAGWQHRGYGRLLLLEAERISAGEYDRRRIVITSALGTREYYRRLGYSQCGPYVLKEVKAN